jgi:hypothetical protein
MTSKSCGKQQAVQTACEIYNKLNPSFESACKMALSATLIKVKNYNYNKRQQKMRREKQRRSVQEV